MSCVSREPLIMQLPQWAPRGLRADARFTPDLRAVERAQAIGQVLRFIWTHPAKISASVRRELPIVKTVRPRNVSLRFASSNSARNRVLPQRQTTRGLVTAKTLGPVDG